MPPKGKKATSKTSKRPQDSPDSDDELKRSVPKKPETPGLEISEEDSASSDQDEQQASTVCLSLEDSELTKSYLAKRKQFRKGVKTSMNVLNRKLLYIYKTQQKERRMLHSKYSQMFVPLFQQWEKDVMKVEQEEESFVNAYEQHVESLKKSAMAQKATIDEAKKISDQFLQVYLEDNHLRLDAVEQCTMEEEMENLKMKLTTENQHQNVMAMETCLFSLLS
uniref:XLR/SYCP3/FAM9 domain-containing protein n=1 Tax=Cricetulus griseus TaxID=10029 RepID=A0A8C2L9T7_CRIGR